MDSIKLYSLTVTEFGMDKLEEYIQSVLGWGIWLSTHSKTMRGEDAVLVGRAGQAIVSNAKALRARLDKGEWSEKEI